MTEKLVVGLVGMPGSGKSLVVEVAKRKGYGVVVMGDVVREETLKQGLALNPEDVGKVMLELRKTGGDGVVAEKCVPKIRQDKRQKVIVDGLRSLAEAEVFKKHFPKFSLVGIHASPQTRYKRLNLRGRSDDSSAWNIFHERDMRELSVGLGSAIAMAEQLIVNEKRLAEAKAEADAALRWVERRWSK